MMKLEALAWPTARAGLSAAVDIWNIGGPEAAGIEATARTQAAASMTIILCSIGEKDDLLHGLVKRTWKN
jgi:hypothetical protein